MAYRDKTKRAAANHRWYLRHHTEHYKKHRAELIAKATSYIKQRRALIQRFKDKPCADCGLRYAFYVMDFDHVRGEKRFNISARRNLALSTLLDEISKCDVVCANCHREREHKRLING